MYKYLLLLELFMSYIEILAVKYACSKMCKKF
jgi:hypothetical protein